VLLALAHEVREKNLKVCFFNSTPQVSQALNTTCTTQGAWVPAFVAFPATRGHLYADEAGRGGGRRHRSGNMCI
jgi:hypothetical protein